MPDGTTETQAQEATAATESNGSRSIDSFPEEAQDYIRRLRAENAGHRNEKKTLADQLKEFQDKDKTDAQRLEDRAATAESGLSAAEMKLQRYEVAAEKGIPLHLAGRLQGSTKEELAADADKLAQDFGLTGNGGSQAPGRPGGFDGGVRRPVTKARDMNDVIRDAAAARLS